MKISYTQSGLSAESGIPLKTINHAIRTGDLEAVKSGRRWIILGTDAQAWLIRGKERGQIEAPIDDEGRERLAERNRRRKAEQPEDAA